ncbi:MAG: hypothetical protein J6F31_02240 [Oscillospiraceae bacterium]|nr:hypothetical protein [Oscillospiraceae bacterium]
MRKIYAWEPWFFIFFGIFHLHRIWALFSREAYASFWMGILQNKGVSYFLIMGVLASLCVLGITVFIKNRKHNFWWRWVYLFGGGYLIFDLFAIAAGIKFWSDLLALMFDTASPYWNVIWMTFILIGALSFALGVSLLYKKRNMNKTDNLH